MKITGAHQFVVAWAVLSIGGLASYGFAKREIDNQRSHRGTDWSTQREKHKDILKHEMKINRYHSSMHPRSNKVDSDSPKS